MPAGKVLRIELKSAATVRWSADDWKTPLEIQTRDTGIGVHVADLPTGQAAAGSDSCLRFTGSTKIAGSNTIFASVSPRQIASTPAS